MVLQLLSYVSQLLPYGYQFVSYVFCFWLSCGFIIVPLRFSDNVPLVVLLLSYDFPMASHACAIAFLFVVL